MAEGGHEVETTTGSQHETRDVRYRPIVGAGIGLVLLTLAAVALMRPFMGLLATRTAGRSEQASPLAGLYGRRQPPQPRLQARPLEDLTALRAAEEAALRGYGWVDEDAGVLRIPVERAKDLHAERGLPARAEAR
jgi:hypothetical protein